MTTLLEEQPLALPGSAITVAIELDAPSIWTAVVVGWPRLGKNKLHELRGVQFLKRFSAKFVKFSAKCGSLNVQIRRRKKLRCAS